MKRITLLALACLAAPQALFAQVYTTPAGYVTKDLAQGFNALGLTLQTPVLVSGDFESVSGDTLTDNQLSFTPIAGRTYILEITTASVSSLVGTIQEVSAASISGTTITTPDDLGALLLAAGDTYKLRLAPTLEEIFTTTSLSSGGVLQAGISSTGADIVWLPTGAGTYNQYFLHTSGQFRIAGTTTPAPNVSVIYADGFYVQKKASTAASLTTTGEIKKVGTNSVISQGYNLVTVVAPVGANLYNAGIEDDIQAGISATGADIVWVQQSNLSYKKYFRHTTNNWRDVDAPTVNMTILEAQAVQLSAAILIQRKSAGSTTLDMNVPASYSGL